MAADRARAKSPSGARVVPEREALRGVVLRVVSSLKVLRVMYGAVSLRWTVALAAAGADSTGGAAGARVAVPAPPPQPCAEPILSVLPALRWSICSSSAAIGFACNELGAPEAPEAGAVALPLPFGAGNGPLRSTML